MHFYSVDFGKYLEKRIDFFCECLQKLRTQPTSLNKLSSGTVICFLLSSLIMGQPSSYPGVAKFIRQASCSDNKLVCFLPDLFSLSGNNVVVSSLIELRHLMGIFKLSFTSLSMLTNYPLTSGSPIVSGLPSELVMFLRLLTRRSENLQLRGIVIRQQEQVFFEHKNNTTVNGASSAWAAISEHGLSLLGLVRFYIIFWKEYLLHVKDHRFQEPYRTTKEQRGYSCFKDPQTSFTQTNYVSSTSSQISMKQKFANILPLPREEERDEAKVRSLIQQGRNWKNFGSRAVFLQLFMDTTISYAELSKFHLLFLFLHYRFTTYHPICNVDKMLVVSRGINLRQNLLLNIPTSDEILQHDLNHLLDSFRHMPQDNSCKRRRLA